MTRKILHLFLVSTLFPVLSWGELVKVGVLVPLTGDSALTYGEQVKRGVLLAQKNIGSRKNIELIFEDSKCTTKDAITGAKKLVEFDKVSAIIGDVCFTDRIASITEPKKIVVISTGSAQSSVRDAGDYVFRLKLDVSVDSKALAREVKAQLNISRIALLYAQSEWGEGIRSNFKEEHLRLGGQVVFDEGFDWNTREFRSLLLKLRQKKPELILVAAVPAQVGLVMKQARELGIKARFAGYRGGIGEETLKLAGAAADGLVFLEEFDSTSNDPHIKAFVREFREAYSSEPNLFGAMGYDAYRLLSKGFQRCGENASCLRDDLYDVANYPGVSGRLSFDEKGDVLKELTFSIIKNGKFVRYAAN